MACIFSVFLFFLLLCFFFILLHFVGFFILFFSFCASPISFAKVEVLLYFLIVSFNVVQISVSKKRSKKSPVLHTWSKAIRVGVRIDFFRAPVHSLLVLLPFLEKVRASLFGKGKSFPFVFYFVYINYSILALVTVNYSSLSFFSCKQWFWWHVGFIWVHINCINLTPFVFFFWVPSLCCTCSYGLMFLYALTYDVTWKFGSFNLF